MECADEGARHYESVFGQVCGGFIASPLGRKQSSWACVLAEHCVACAMAGHCCVASALADS